MRELVIFGFSSILTPPNSSASHHHHHHHHHHPKPYKSPLRKSTTTATKLLSLPPPSSPPISTVPPYSPLLSNVRWDLTSRHKSHLKYYADLASKLAEDGRIQDFVLIAESVIVSGVQAWQFVAALSLETVKKGFARCLCEEKVWTVVEVLRNVQKLGIPPSELIDKCNKELLGRECCRIVNSGPIEELVELMEILAGLHFAVKELVEPADIVRVCVANHNPNIAIRYACILPHTHVLFSTIIYEFGKKRDLVSALTVYEASKQKMSAPNMYVYRTIIDVCGLCGDYMKSRYIYEDLLSQKVTPNIYVYNSLMNVNSHDLSYAFHVYKDMQNSGVMADMASYNILLKVCCLAGRVDLARDIYRDVQHLESTGVLSLDLFTYTTIIKVFADAKLWQMARRVKDDMLSAGVTPNTIAWSSLISACANAGLVEQTIQLFEDMLLAGCEPNSQCCNILLHACVEARQYDRAFRLFQSWKRSKVQDDYRDNIKGSLAEGNANKQCNTISSNDASNPYYLSFAKKFPFTPTTTTYNILMKACGSDYYRARALIDEMKTIGLSPNHISWSILINICGGSRNSEGALQILKTMRASGNMPDVIAYTTAIKVCVERKNLKMAFSLFAEMKRYRIKPNLVTYATLLRARSRYGSLHEVQQCLTIYQDMRKAGYKANDFYLKELIEEWCEGVIQNNNQNQGRREFIPCIRTDFGRPQSLLLEKVAAHLHKSITESLAIDLRGLTKVEARIVVLAVLRMIKENYALGHCVNDDVMIILGVSKVAASQAKHEYEMKDVIIKLLQNELGLEVCSTGPRVTVDQKIEWENPHATDPNLEEIREDSRLPSELETSTRRPLILERLKITRKSLRHWLKRKSMPLRGDYIVSTNTNFCI